MSFRLAITLSIIALCAAPAAAQVEAPRWEFFGGYSFGEFVGDSLNHDSSNGIGAAVSYNVTDHFGLTTDLTTQFFEGPAPIFCLLVEPCPPGGSAISRRTQFLSGPTFTLRGERFNWFGRGLFGVERASFRAGISDARTGFAMAYGGGLDYVPEEGPVIRIIQVDYLPSRVIHVGSKFRHNLRIQTGIVFRFGE